MCVMLLLLFGDQIYRHIKFWGLRGRINIERNFLRYFELDVGRYGGIAMMLTPLRYYENVSPKLLTCV